LRPAQRCLARAATARSIGAQEAQSARQKEQQAKQRREQEQRAAAAGEAELQIRRRHEALLPSLPAGTYIKESGQPCREGFRQHTETRGQQVAEQGSGEMLYFCVPST
jgi:hypothetical protein